MFSYHLGATSLRFCFLLGDTCLVPQGIVGSTIQDFRQTADIQRPILSGQRINIIFIQTFYLVQKVEAFLFKSLLLCKQQLVSICSVSFVLGVLTISLSLSTVRLILCFLCCQYTVFLSPTFLPFHCLLL